jgi:acetyl-CoA carboxylase biotin carboxyl carrier protein
VKAARIRSTEDGLIEVRSSLVGEARGLPRVGDVIGAGSVVARVSTLGVMVDLVLPSDAPTGRVHARIVGKSAHVGVGHDEVLFTYGTAEAVRTEAASTSSSGALVFRAPMAGRFYRKASPDKPALVEVGDIVEAGRALGLVEVMKTFHRISYGGEGMPARVRIVRALVADGEDIAQGDALFEIEVSG